MSNVLYLMLQDWNIVSVKVAYAVTTDQTLVCVVQVANKIRNNENNSTPYACLGN